MGKWREEILGDGPDLFIEAPKEKKEKPVQEGLGL